MANGRAEAVRWLRRGLALRGAAERAGLVALDAMFPPQCPITGRPVDQAGAIAPEAWREVRFLEPPWCETCGAPFLKTPAAGIVCGACAAGDFRFDVARAAFAYDPASARLVTALKHGDRTELAAPLARFVARAGRDLWADVDLVAPAPLHPVRQWRRKFNQAHEIGRRVAEIIEKPYEPTLLKRVKATPPQQSLSRAQRLRNVTGAFRVASPLMVKGARVAVIDDVLTTGATANAMAKALKRAGARSVAIVTAARVVKGGDAAI
ncbi:MAG: ComF family protein [Pseudomonadota bacterium]